MLVLKVSHVGITWFAFHDVGHDNLRSRGYLIRSMPEFTLGLLSVYCACPTTDPLPADFAAF